MAASVDSNSVVIRVATFNVHSFYDGKGQWRFDSVKELIRVGV